MQNEAKRKNRCSSIKEQKRQAEQVEKMLQSAVKMRQDKKNAEFVASCVFAFRCGKPAIGLLAANKKQIDMKK